MSHSKTTVPIVPVTKQNTLLSRLCVGQDRECAQCPLHIQSSSLGWWVLPVETAMLVEGGGHGGLLKGEAQNQGCVPKCLNLDGGPYLQLGSAAELRLIGDIEMP